VENEVRRRKKGKEKERPLKIAECLVVSTVKSVVYMCV
jgi:hypothetical protein